MYIFAIKEENNWIEGNDLSIQQIINCQAFENINRLIKKVVRDKYSWNDDGKIKKANFSQD